MRLITVDSSQPGHGRNDRRSEHLWRGKTRELHVHGNEQARYLSGHQIYDQALGVMHGKSNNDHSEEPRGGACREFQCKQGDDEHLCD